MGAWLRPGGKLSLENLSFLLIFASTALIVAGIGLGSFVQYTVFLAAFGSFVLLAGIILYIASQLITPSQERGEQKREGTNP